MTKPRCLRVLMGSLLLVLPSAWILQAAETAATFKLDETSFRCMREMTPVRHFYVDNLAGNLDGTLAAANAPEGAIYPTGSVVQLVPTEVMVKRDPGFSPVTGDWEFFELEVSASGSTIQKGLCRGQQPFRQELLWLPCPGKGEVGLHL